MLKTLVLIFALSAAAQVGKAASIGNAAAGCQFVMEGWWEYYCECTGVTVTSENDILEFSAHLPDHSNSDIRRISFVNSRLDTIPSMIFETFPNLGVVEAAGVGMTRLNVGTLRNCQNLNELQLANNSISRLDNGVFRNCPALLRINFSNNQISSVGEHILADTPTLRIFQMSGNLLTEISERLFQNRGSLQQILVNFNRISQISSTMFRGNPGLTNVALHGNQITHIPDDTFADMGFHFLSLGSNLISTIGRRAFAKAGSVSSKSGGLDLSNNRITRLSSESGIGPSFVNIDLSNNGLVAIEPNFFDVFTHSVTVSAIGNVCVNRSFSMADRTTLNEGMAVCYANY